MDSILTWASAVLATTPDRWDRLTQTLPADLLSKPPAAGEWSAVGCLQHLIDTEQIFIFRVQAFLDGRDFPDFNPDSEGTSPSQAVSPVELARRFGELRLKSLAAIEKLSPQDLKRQAQHAELGWVSLSQMLHEWAGHDLMHTVQAERALMQPFIQGCGPWHKYFIDHVAG